MFGGGRSRKGDVFGGGRSRKGDVFGGGRSRKGDVFGGGRSRKGMCLEVGGAGRGMCFAITAHGLCINADGGHLRTLCSWKLLLSPQAILTSPLELTALEVQLHGGVVTEDFDESVTHVVCNMRWALID